MKTKIRMRKPQFRGEALVIASILAVAVITAIIGTCSLHEHDNEEDTIHDPTAYSP